MAIQLFELRSFLLQKYDSYRKALMRFQHGYDSALKGDSMAVHYVLEKNEDLNVTPNCKQETTNLKTVRKLNKNVTC